MYNSEAAEYTERMANLKTNHEKSFLRKISKSPTVSPSERGGLWRMMGEEHIKVGNLHQRAWLIVARTESRTAGVMVLCESVSVVSKLFLTHMRFSNIPKWEFTQHLEWDKWGKEYCLWAIRTYPQFLRLKVKIQQLLIFKHLTHI